jgi:hypothetical protein
MVPRDAVLVLETSTSGKTLPKIIRLQLSIIRIDAFVNICSSTKLHIRASLWHGDSSSTVAGVRMAQGLSF